MPVVGYTFTPRGWGRKTWPDSISFDGTLQPSRQLLSFDEQLMFDGRNFCCLKEILNRDQSKKTRTQTSAFSTLSRLVDKWWIGFRLSAEKNEFFHIIFSFFKPAFTWWWRSISLACFFVLFLIDNLFIKWWPPNGGWEKLFFRGFFICGVLLLVWIDFFRVGPLSARRFWCLRFSSEIEILVSRNQSSRLY